MNSEQRKEMDGPNYAVADDEMEFIPLAPAGHGEAVSVQVGVESIDDNFFDTDESYPEGEGCPACGELIDFCQGHGEIGDYQGYLVSQQHDNGDHSNCNPRGCEEANQK